MHSGLGCIASLLSSYGSALNTEGEVGGIEQRGSMKAGWSVSMECVSATSVFSIVRQVALPVKT